MVRKATHQAKLVFLFNKLTMSSNIDMPLDSLVVKTRRGGMRGGRGVRGGGRFGPRLTRGGVKGVGKTSSIRGRASKRIGITRAGGITSRLGFGITSKSAQNVGKGPKNVSDLRDVIATKSKTVPDLREKLPPKATKRMDKAKPSTRVQNSGQSQLKISSDMFRSAKTRGSVNNNSSYSKEAIFAQDPKSNSKISHRLPTTSEAKKITVTVQGLSKTTSEVSWNSTTWLI